MSRSRLTTVLDWLILAGLLAAITIYVGGGFSIRVGGLRLTARSPDRTLLFSLAVLVVRWSLDRRTPPFAAARRAWLQLKRHVYHPDTDIVPAVPREAKWRGRAAACLGIAVFTSFALYPQLTHMDSVTDLGDPLFSIWRLGWVHHQLTGGPGPLFEANIFYPAPLTFTYSDSMLLPGLTAAPFLAAGISPVVAYNIVLVGSFVASALAAYLLVEYLTGSAAAAFIAALIFGFYPYRFEHYSHLELLATYCMPLALLALHRFLDGGGVRAAVFAGVLTAAQLYCSMYYAVFFMWYAAAIALVSCIVRPVPLRRLGAAAGLAAVIAIAIALPLYRTYRAAHLGDREAHEIASYSATAADYFRPHDRSAAWGRTAWATTPPRPAERALFPGGAALVLAALALLPPIGARRLVYAAALLVAFELSRGLNGVFYPYLYDWLPFMRGLRSPARASVLVGLTLAVLAGFAVRRWFAGAPPRRAIAFALTTLAIAVDLRPSLQLERVWPEPPPLYGSIAGVPGVVLAEFPLGGDPDAWVTDTPHMYFSLWHWAKLINGYSGHAPATYSEFQRAMRAFPDDTTIALLRGRGTTHITVNCVMYHKGCETLLDRIDQRPEFRLLTSGRWQSRPVRLYELIPPAPAK